VLNEARRQLEAVRPSIGNGAGVNVNVHVASGPAVETIAAHADATDADLIVVGRSKRFMRLGATGARLLRHTNRALLIVPPAASAHAAGVAASSLQRAA
jgi:nucleotide-binding universal stress UspA family protein